MTVNERNTLLELLKMTFGDQYFSDDKARRLIKGLIRITEERLQFQKEESQTRQPRHSGLADASLTSTREKRHG